MFVAPLQEDKISTLVKAAGVEVEPYWPAMFAKIIEKTNLDDLIGAIGSAPAPGAGAPAAGGGDAGGEAAPAEEEKKEESEEEEDGDMGFDLFD